MNKHIRKAAVAADRLSKSARMPKKKKPPRGTLRMKSKTSNNYTENDALNFDYFMQRAKSVEERSIYDKKLARSSTVDPSVILRGLDVEVDEKPKQQVGRHMECADITLLLIYFSEARVHNARLIDTLCRRAAAVPLSQWDINLALSVIKAFGILNADSDDCIATSRTLFSAVKQQWEKDNCVSKFGVSVWLASTYLTPEDVSQLVSFFTIKMGVNSLQSLPLSCVFRYLSAASTLVNENRCPGNVLDLAIDILSGEYFKLPRSPSTEISALIVWTSVVILRPFVNMTYSYAPKNFSFRERLREIFDHYSLIRSHLDLTNAARLLWSFSVCGERLPAFVVNNIFDSIERELSKKGLLERDYKVAVNQLLISVVDLGLKEKTFPSVSLLIAVCDDIYLLSSLHAKSPDIPSLASRVAELISLNPSVSIPSRSMPSVLQCCITFINTQRVSSDSSTQPDSDRVTAIEDWCRQQMGSISEWVSDCKDQSLFLLVWCAASLRHTNQSDVKKLVSRIVDSKEIKVTSQEISSVALSHRQLSVLKYPLLTRLCLRLSDPSVEFFPSDIASSLWSFTRIRVTDEPLIKRITAEAEKHQTSLSSEELQSIKDDLSTIRRRGRNQESI
eukprot:TRINITY_DN5997_c0_g1_i2.p1 TRINITY_DN5997_c0_g1~~TRINITY_DN5997_c0_g1_i2.p1  ORF type:complete len:619 (+),score=93.19 TRINITY_DN5997_c0_g1_i2:63-1919(+)